jgi:hypothetical protein
MSSIWTDQSLEARMSVLKSSIYIDSNDESYHKQCLLNETKEYILSMIKMESFFFVFP